MRRTACLIVSLAVVSAAVAKPPRPGLTDTFTRDAYLRRVDHPLTVKLIEYGGEAGKNVPVTFGLACGEGDFARGMLQPMIDGKTIPAQVDVLAAWPKDKSIRHALLTIVVPEIEADGVVELTFKQAHTRKPKPFKSAAKLNKMHVGAEFVGPDGAAGRSSLHPAMLSRMDQILSGEGKAGGLAPRLAGPICYEFEIHDRPRSNAGSDPDLDVYYRVRVYSGVETVRVAWVVENTRMPAPPLPKKWTHTDRDLKSVRFLVGEKDNPRVVAENGPMTHWFGTRYRVVGHSGPDRPMVYAKQSLPYLVYAQFFPKLDLAHPLTDDQVERITGKKWFRKSYDPLKRPDGGILDHGPLHAHMPGTGGRPDIGPYADWHRMALASDSPKLHHYARAADGNGLGAFPIHRRSGATLDEGAPYDDDVHPIYWDSKRGRIDRVRFNRGKTRCPNTPDQSHTPSAAYYSYLTTGEKYFEEELAFWAMVPSTNWPHHGKLPGSTRARAWQLRNVTDAAFLLPDDHARKKYLSEYVWRNLGMLAEELQLNGHLMGRGNRKCSGRKNWVCASRGSVWMYTWLVWSLDNAARKGFGRATGIREGAADLLYRLYAADEEFKAPNGKTYRYNPALAMPYNMAIRLVQVDFRNDGKEIETDLGSITDNTGKMYYYNLVNESHQYWYADSTSAAYRKWKTQHVTGQVMKPVDWRPDPNLEVRAAEETEGAWHDYGNEACAAALARYANPRAQMMYTYVRAWIDNHRADDPKRLPGVEYLK